MNINADYSQKVVINHHDLPWVPSPESGVERRLLERQGDEVAKATSMVRYQPGSKFKTHHHELGFVGKVTLLSPIVGEFANDDEVRPMNFVPPYAERLFELASSGKFSVPVNCEIHVGSEDWQSCPNSKAFGDMVGIKVHVVEGAGHMFPKEYVSALLDHWQA